MRVSANIVRYRGCTHVPRPASCHIIFAGLDEDGSGTISVNELQAWMTTMQRGEQDIEAMMKALDVDGSGQVCKVLYGGERETMP